MASCGLDDGGVFVTIPDALVGVLVLSLAVTTLAFAVLVALAVRWVRRLMARHEVVGADMQARHAERVESIRAGARRAEGRFRL